MSWRFVGAAVVGTSHLRLSQSCHDSFKYQLLSSGEVVIVVSDGAGSAAKAAEGSSLIVKTAMVSLERHLTMQKPVEKSDWETIIQAVFQEAKAALIEESSKSGAALRDYAATLILIVLAEKWIACGLIGDCTAVVLNESGELFSLCVPQKGEYANMTNFLTQPNALEQLDIQILEDVFAQGAAVLSDGLLELALNIAQNKPYAPFFNPLFAFVASVEDEQEAKTQLEAFLNSDRVNARTDDDKTLVLVCRNEAK